MWIITARADRHQMGEFELESCKLMKLMELGWLMMLLIETDNRFHEISRLD
jgi:hypothetical protein